MSVPEITRLLSLRAAREACGVSQATFHRWIKESGLPVIRVHGRTLIDPADLTAFLDAHKNRRERRALKDDSPRAGGPVVEEIASDGRDQHEG